MRAVRPRLTWGTLVFLTLAVPAAAQQKPTLKAADYAKWESIGATELSPDGRWIAYVISRVDDDGELRFRAIADDSTHVVRHAYRPIFSADGRWLAYGIGVSQAERERVEKANQTVRSKVGIVDLRAGTTTVVDNIASYDFSGDSRYLALRGFAVRDKKSKGVDLIVRDLTRGTDMNFGNVAAHGWQDRGGLLAMIIDADNKAGNGVQLFDPRTGVLRTLESDTAEYTGLTWRKASDDLAVLRIVSDDRYEDPSHTAIAWRGVAGSRMTQLRFDHATRSDFPTGHRIVDGRDLRWTDDGATIYFGIREHTLKPGKAAAADTATSDSASTVSITVADSTTADTTAAGRAAARATAQKRDEPAGVEVWHSADVDIIPEQKVRANMERNRSMLSAWHLNGDRFVRIATDLAEDATLSGGRMAVVLDGQPYGRDRMFGPVYRDVYTVDVTTGERTRAVERVQYQYGPSSATGRYLLYNRDGDYWTFDTQTGRHTNITKDLPTSFVNLDNDLTISEKPPFGTGGWTTGDRSVLLYDKYDIWEVRPDGSRGVNLTNGASDRIRYRRMWLDPEHRIVDMSRPVYVSLYGEWTKQFGYGRIRSGAAPERLVFMDRNITRLGKAKEADVYYYRMEAFDESPNWYVGGPGLADARRVTDTNAFQKDYAWGRSELIDFTNTQGRELQAALHYPANYEPGRRYPMVVYYYEITSNQIHSYSVPSLTSPYNPTVFTQNGYFVLRPDIVYRGRNPGVSAVEALIPAVDRVIEMGMVDGDRVGLVGHSWGGYQTAFTVTQTDRFRAAVAGAPLTNLISMYLSIYWNSGSTDARIFEISQGRMEVPFWEDTESYIRNSPVFHIERMNTPLLVAFGDKDGAVEFNQGVEMYNAARRAGKDMVLLVYEGENHSLARKPNQLDYHRRIQEWFGHYLKDEPAPEWMVKGVNHIARQRELDLIRRGENGGR
ncbi:prolyl oligopeptidase family serine peptidase [soil metagenome]